MVSFFFKEAMPDRMAKLETLLDVERPVRTTLSNMAPMGEEKCTHPWARHTTVSGKDGVQPRVMASVHPSRALDYIIPNLCEVIPGN